MSRELSHEAAEEQQSLWLLVAAPSLWALHFLTSYIAGALYCGTPDPMKGMVPLRTGILVGGLFVTIGIAIVARIGWRKYRHEGNTPLEKDTPEARHRFLGVATLLLAALSAMATLFTCIGVLFIPNCL